MGADIAMNQNEMNQHLDIPLRFITESSSDDIVIPFQVDALDVRGRCVHLGAAIDTMLERHAYPPAVARVLAEAVILTSLLGTALKFEGRFQLQTRTDGAINMLVVDFDAPNKLRGYARFDADKVQEIVEKHSTQALNAKLLGSGYLGLTIEQGADSSSYQGIVALEGQGLQAAALQYFKQSEQIPTYLRVAVGEVINNNAGKSHINKSNANKSHIWRGGGILVQFLPVSPERQRQGEQAGDVPEGYAQQVFQDDEAWVEACALAQTVEDHELLDPQVSSEQLLYRLFHEQGVRVFEGVQVQDACRCSNERIMDMLTQFNQDDRNAMIADDGTIGVTCEFCSKHYCFQPTDF